MKAAALCLLGCLLTAMPLAAQNRDFLSADEADQIREAQDPALRLTLYAKFARDRIRLIEQLVAKEKPGRSLLLHDTLEDYSNMIDAIDAVIDDALIRKAGDIKLGLEAIAKMEKEVLPILQKIEESQPKDLARYQFVLQQAIVATEDSLELALKDVKERSAELSAKEAREQKERESMMSSSEVKERRKQEADAEAASKNKKAPTLRRKGETAPPPR
jgi:hypothetical protein